MKPLIFAAALCLPTLASAQCPVGADMTKGVRFDVQLSDGYTTETFRRLDNGIVESQYVISPGTISRLHLAQGIYMISSDFLENGVPVPDDRTTFNFDVPIAELPLPVPGNVFRSEVVAFSTIEGTRDELHEYSYSEPRVVRFGTCKYEMIEVTVRYLLVPGGFSEVYQYLPALGLSYMVQANGDGYIDQYNYTGIERVE